MSLRRLPDADTADIYDDFTAEIPFACPILPRASARKTIYLPLMSLGCREVLISSNSRDAKSKDSERDQMINSFT